MAEQALKRLLITPLIFIIFFILGVFLAAFLNYSGLGVMLFLILAFAGPAIGLFIAGKIFPGENITFSKKS